MILTRRSSPWTAAAVAAGFLAAAAFAAHAALSNGALGFPLDDAWIHLNYARTLREHGTFAYFAGGPPTAGSTAPLFTLLEAAGFMITSHEKPLALLLGLAGQLAFLVAFARWSARRLGDARWAALAVALVGLDGRAALLAVSGWRRASSWRFAHWRSSGASRAVRSPRGWRSAQRSGCGRTP